MEYIKEFFKILGVVAGIILAFAFVMWPLALEGTDYFWIGGVWFGLLLFICFAGLAWVNVQEKRRR